MAPPLAIIFRTRPPIYGLPGENVSKCRNVGGWLVGPFASVGCGGLLFGGLGVGGFQFSELHTVCSVPIRGSVLGPFFSVFSTRCPSHTAVFMYPYIPTTGRSGFK